MGKKLKLKAKRKALDRGVLSFFDEGETADPHKGATEEGEDDDADAYDANGEQVVAGEGADGTSLPWRIVSNGDELGDEPMSDAGSGGFMLLEELSGCTVEWQGGGRVARIVKAPEEEVPVVDAIKTVSEKKKQKKKKAKTDEETPAKAEKQKPEAEEPAGSDSEPQLTTTTATATTTTTTTTTKKEKKKSRAEILERQRETKRQKQRERNLRKRLKRKEEAIAAAAGEGGGDEATKKPKVVRQAKAADVEVQEAYDFKAMQMGDAEDESDHDNGDDDDDDDKEEEDDDDDDDENDEGLMGEDVDMEGDYSAWQSLKVHPDLIMGLRRLRFTEPTEIQRKTLPATLQGRRDMVGAAETGSGKTLAFAMPILQHIVYKKIARKLTALIVTPTRELAMQVRDHIRGVSQHLAVRTVAIVGGIAVPKQERLLRAQPEIIVATPGRLWELIQQGNAHLKTISSDLRFFVADEADRMIERGHYEELDRIVSVLPQQSNVRKYIFSATLLPPENILLNRKSQHAKPQSKSKKKATAAPVSSLEQLVARLALAPSPVVIDLTRRNLLAGSLTEAHVMCTVEEKDLYLYYFIKRYPGKTLVFVNSIDCIRRLVSILTLLDIEPLALHANMQQRQRLKNLDRFRERSECVIVATDVAARGLDIPGVQHVVHYQLPRTVEVYVHRSGRTARAHTQGISVAIVSPPDLPAFRNILSALHTSVASDDVVVAEKDEDAVTSRIPAFPVDSAYLAPLRRHLVLARKVDKAMHSARKTKSANDWFVNAARDLDLELDDDLLEDIGSEDEVRGGEDDGLSRAQQKKQAARQALQRAEAMRRDLLQMIREQPIIPRGLSQRYVADGSATQWLSVRDGEMVSAAAECSKTAAVDAVKGKGKKRKRAVDDEAGDDEE